MSVILAFMLFWAIIGAIVASRTSPMGGFVLGLILGPIGVIIALFLKAPQTNNWSAPNPRGRVG